MARSAGEREALREREPGVAAADLYEGVLRHYNGRLERAATGRVVVKGSSTPFEQGRQALVRYYLHPEVPDTAVDDLTLFEQEIRTQSGKHRHQGGLAIFILEGTGYTVVDGERFDWEAGDLILLPIKPGGCEHQHFNTTPGGSARWLALVPIRLREAIGNKVEQLENHPDYRPAG